ncbi:M64 family metallopeptidase [Actinoplanes sp. NPDC000266]
MTTADGQVLGVTRIIDHGPPTERWNLVILGDGYRANQITQYHQDANRLCVRLEGTRPFDSVWSGLNLYRVDVTSTDSGADDPAACGGPGTTARTYFDAAFCNNGTRRLLTVNQGTALSVAGQQVPQFHAVVVIVNSQVYGGSGGAAAAYSLATGAEQIALHEMGHGAFGLADEYEYYLGCGVDTDRNRHPAVEPGEPNVTVNTNRATLKWRSLVAAATPIPTTRNADCSQCDPQPNPLPAATVGLYEGAHYYHCGAFRPQFDCRMRDIDQEFCAVCAQQIRRVLLPFTPVTVPFVQEARRTIAHQRVVAAGLVPRFTGPTGPSAWVWRQSPAAGRTVRYGSEVTMQLRTGPIP